MSDLLHTPTPWHNCIVKVEGHQTLYLAKSRVVSEAVDSNAYEARWVVEDSEVAGGYYLLRKKGPVVGLWAAEKVRTDDGVRKAHPCQRLISQSASSVT